MKILLQLFVIGFRILMAGALFLAGEAGIGFLESRQHLSLLVFIGLWILVAMVSVEVSGILTRNLKRQLESEYKKNQLAKLTKRE